jgi:hypothetical protein
MRAVFSNMMDIGKVITKPLRNQKHIVNSYKRVFAPDGELSEDARLVLGHLRLFCGQDATDHSNDPVMIARMTGRKEGLNWILKHIEYKDIFKLEEQIREFEEIYKDE